MHDPAQYHTSVVIVGAGPTGLTAAVRLAQLGIDALVVDRSATPTATSKAALVHAATLELLEQLGVAQAAVGAGVPMRRLAVMDRGRPLMSVDFSQLEDDLPVRLGAAAERNGGFAAAPTRGTRCSVLRPVVIESVTAEGDGYLVRGAPLHHAGRHGSRHQRARPVRDRRRRVAQPGAGGDGHPLRPFLDPEQFVLADVALARADARTQQQGEQATIYLSPAGVTVIGSLPGGTHRVIATGLEDSQATQDPSRDLLMSCSRLAASPFARPRTRSGPRAFESITASPGPSGRAGSSWPVTPHTSTALQRGRA